jgi:hypothetical protein
MGHVRERARVSGALMEICPRINARTLACGSSQVSDRVVSCGWLVSAARSFAGELHPNGVFGERTCQNEILVDGSDQQAECSGELRRIAVTNEVGQVRTERR